MKNLRAKPVFAFLYLIYYYVLTRILDSSKEYIIDILDAVMDQPMGYKQNKIINGFLGNLFISAIESAEGMSILSSIFACSKVIFLFYKLTITTLRETRDLLTRKTYNPIKKRYDSIYLEKDQATIAVIIFSFTILIYINIVLFYFAFVAFYVMISISELIKNFIENMFSDYSLDSSLQISMQNSCFKAYFLRKILLGEL